jgi:hypothetical protein
MRVLMRNEMMPEVSLKVKLTPNGAPPVRQNTWRDEADKCDNDFVMMLWYLFCCWSEVPLKVKLTPNGAPPVRQRT